MNKDKIKNIPITEVLSRAGYNPKSRGGKYWMYLSPFGREAEASFAVNTHKNTFYDYHSGKGGDVITLVMELEHKTFREACRFLLDNQSVHAENYTPPPQEPGIKIITESKVTDKELLDYFGTRGIKSDLLNEYCKEVTFSFPHGKNPNKTFTAVGFKNDLGGWELRSSWMKISSSPKSFRTIRGAISDVVDIYEGAWDFLAYMAYKGAIRPTNTSYILNGKGMIRVLKPFLKNKKIIYRGDNDKSGDEVLEEISSLNVEDRRKDYMFFDDFNDFLIASK